MRSPATAIAGLSWFAIVRLGLVQSALGAIVVLTTSTLNRVMVVELALAASVPGALVGLHYAVQILRPLWGYGSDAAGLSGRRTAWILGGMALLALSATGAAASIGLVEINLLAGLAALAVSFVGIGIGVGAAGTSLLAFLASTVAPQRRPASATIVWMMMIAGMALTAILAGAVLDPYSPARLLAVTAIVGLCAMLLAVIAVYRLENSTTPIKTAVDGRAAPIASFRDSLTDAWREPEARLFTLFVFLSMLAYSAQDLILEPFAGIAFSMTPGETTQLAGLQHGGVFLGMAAAGVLGTGLARRRPGILKRITVGGCLCSAVALALLGASAAFAPAWPLTANVFVLGVANGAFAVAAIGSMMALAGAGSKSREGLRMGLWGAAQALAFGLGGFVGTVAVDLVRAVTASPLNAYATVFTIEAALFFFSALLAARIALPAARPLVPPGTTANTQSVAPIGVQPAE